MNYIEFIVYGNKTDKDYLEDILAERIPTEKQAKEIELRAKKMGFKTRIAKIDLSEKPSFIGTLNIK